MFLRGRAAGADLRQVVGAQHADRVHHHGERDHQLDRRRDQLTRLQRDTPHHDHGVGYALAAQRRQQRRHNAVRQGGEEAGHNRAQVERRRQNDDVLGIEHFV